MSRRRSYKYDVALSFAGEDRKHAASLSQMLVQRGFSVFYDADRRAALWGKTTKTFDQIYGPQSRYVIPFISKHYVRKDWTRYEFEAAKREEGRRRGDFILPVRLDDSPLLGLHSGIVWLDSSDTTIAEVAELFAKKCRPSRSVPTKATSLLALAGSLLDQESRQALSLIATAAMPLSVENLKKLFPQYEWRRLVRRFQRAGLVRERDGAIEAVRAVRESLARDRNNRKAIDDLWIERLGSLSAHMDTAAFLALHLLLARRFEDAARALVDIAQGTTLGFWNSIYVVLLRALRHRRSFSVLKRETRLELLNSLGKCLTEAGDHEEAMRIFQALRRLSVSYGSSWGVGQSLINSGVASHRSGDDKRAARFYASAARFARRTGDRFLLGRALSNLAQASAGEDLDRSLELLAESLKAKAAARDWSGLAVGHAIRGSLAVEQQDFAEAARWFEKSSREAERLGMRHEWALSVYNHGRALADGGNRNGAIERYALARNIAIEDGYDDVLALASQALGQASFEKGQYRKSKECAAALLKLSETATYRNYRQVALHMMACSHLALGLRAASKENFRLALKEARSRGDNEWIVRCLVDSTRRLTAGSIGNPNQLKLKQMARSEMVAGRGDVAASVWAFLARLSSALGLDDDVSEAYATADICLSSVPRSAPSRVELGHEWFSWAWESRRTDEAINVLLATEKLSRRSRLAIEAIRALDQRGVCLQDLGRYSDAEKLHRAAVLEARRIGDADQLERSLNNLGEALRHLDRAEDAVPMLREAEKIARRAKRIEGALFAAQNRALALKALRRYTEAERLLRKCRDEATRTKNWDVYVHAWSGLASLAWAQGRLRLAASLYRRALREARSRDIAHRRPGIALNFARLLHAQSRPKSALRVLEPFRSEFKQSVDATDYFATLARLYEASGQLELAAAAFEEGRIAAESIADSHSSSEFEVGERRVRNRLKQESVSDRVLSRALSVERSPKRRAELMIRRVERALAGKNDPRAQRIFDEALQYCVERGLPQEKARLYVLVGDVELRGGYKRKLDGCKAYVMAIVSALESDAEGIADISAHVFHQLGSINSSVTSVEIRRLVGDLQKFIQSEIPERVHAFLLWPFVMARDLAPLRHRSEDYLAALSSLTSAAGIKRHLAAKTDRSPAA